MGPPGLCDRCPSSPGNFCRSEILGRAGRLSWLPACRAAAASRTAPAQAPDAPIDLHRSPATPRVERARTSFLEGPSRSPAARLPRMRSAVYNSCPHTCRSQCSSGTAQLGGERSFAATHRSDRVAPIAAVPEISLRLQPDPSLLRGWCCVKKARERHAVGEMKEDPSEPSCREGFKPP